MSALYKFSASGGTLPRRVRDGDPHGRRLRHGGSVALGGFAALVQYSPARRTYFVRIERIAGTRPVPEAPYYEDCGSDTCAQYGGNVSRMAHSLAHGNTDYGESRDVTYIVAWKNETENFDFLVGRKTKFNSKESKNGQDTKTGKQQDGHQ